MKTRIVLVFNANKARIEATNLSMASYKSYLAMKQRQYNKTLSAHNYVATNNITNPKLLELVVFTQITGVQDTEIRKTMRTKRRLLRELM